MNDRVHAKTQAQHVTLSGSLPKGSLLQRTCASGQHTPADGEYSSWRNKHSTLHLSHRAFEPPSAPDAVAGGSAARDINPSIYAAFDRASHFGHDFRRIPIHAPAAGVIQTTLALNQPGDHYEQEADRLSEHVMRMPEPPLQRACACGGACPHCQTEQPGQKQAGLQTKRVKANDTAQLAAPPSVHDVLRSPGQPLDPATRAFMEPRFGHDFSHVRVRSGTAAEQSARDVNAHAYTVGHNIVFGAGRLAPGTHEGRRLIAHELVHVVQQTGADATCASRRVDTCSLPPTTLLQQGGGPSQFIQHADDADGKGDKAEGVPAAGGRVLRVVIAEDGVLTIETSSTDYLYELDQWNIPQGTYTASVSIDGSTVKFDFGKDFARFNFTYRINRGQDNPATLLKGQKSVTVDVVASHKIDPAAKPIQCLLPMHDQVLIDAVKSSTPLFKPIKKQATWFIGKVPLGFLGWIDVDAKAGLSLAGLLSYGYGPGVLSGICLYQTLGGGRLGGTARFTFGAAMSPSVHARAGLEAVARYVGVVDLVGAGGTLDVSAVGRLSGALDGRVQLSFDPHKNKWNLDAEALILGSAGLKLTGTASATITLLYKDIWSKHWKLIDADFHVGWKGGLRVGTDTRPRFDFGSVGILSDADKIAPPSGPQLATATAPNPLASEAVVDDEKMLEASINKDTDPNDPAKVAMGLTPDDALPIIWYKPLNIYPKTIAIPRAIRPETLDRDDGPTEVEYGASRRRTGREFIGVGDDDRTNQTNWPLPVRRAKSPGKRFQYVEKTAGDMVKNRLRNTFNDELLPVGHTLAGDGFDIDHVHEKQFGGQDAAPNLWPAQSNANRRAGGRHDDQLNAYRGTIGTIAGRWFEIILVRNP